MAEEARILAVMISRARHGVVVTVSTTVSINSGAIRSREPSQFWTPLAMGGWMESSAIEAWFERADWRAIARR